MKRILIVDEDVNQIHPFSIELQLRGIGVVQCPTADECLRVLSGDQTFSLALVDLMLAADPASTMFSRENTDNYSLTGVILCQEIRKNLPELPIVLFTGASFTDLATRAQAALDDLGNAVMIRKYEFATPFEFGEEVEKILKFGTEVQRHSGITQKIFESLILQPNFAGLGLRDAPKIISFYFSDI